MNITTKDSFEQPELLKTLEKSKQKHYFVATVAAQFDVLPDGGCAAVVLRALADRVKQKVGSIAIGDKQVIEMTVEGSTITGRMGVPYSGADDF